MNAYSQQSKNKAKTIDMGLLSRKYTLESEMPDDDISIYRATCLKCFIEAVPDKGYHNQLEARETNSKSNSRILVQEAVAYIRRKISKLVRITGLKTYEQIEKNVSISEPGAITNEQMQKWMLFSQIRRN